LLQLHAIARHEDQVFVEVRLHDDSPSYSLSTQEREHLSDGPIQVEVYFLQGCLFEEGPNAPYHLSGFLAVANNAFGSLPRFGHAGRLSRQPPKTGVTVCYNSSQRLIYFVRDGGGKFANRGAPRGSRQAGLTIAQSFLYVFPVIDVD
jgi:hypothetical protein